MAESQVAGQEYEPGATQLPTWAARPVESRGVLRVGEIGFDVVALAKALEVPTTALVVAALARVVGALAGEDEISIGLASGGRCAPFVADLAGASWRELIAKAFSELIEVSTNLESANESRGELAVGAVGEPGRGFYVGFGPVPGAGWTASLAGEELWLEHDLSQFGADYADRVGDYLLTSLVAMVGEVDGLCLSTPLLGVTERYHLIHERSGVSCQLPDQRFHELFAAQARQRPEQVAIVHAGRSVSYDWLNRTANQIAHALRANGLRDEEVVALATERDPYWAAAIIGIFKAGGVFLPIDPGYPAARVATLLQQSRCRLVLTPPQGLASLELLGDGLRPVGLPLADAQLAGFSDQEPQIEVRAEQLAYIYFTSGSTGLPKGAMCEHLGMVNHLTAKMLDLGLGPADVVIQNAQSTFDISLWQLVAPLMFGGRSVIVTNDEILDVRRFIDTVVEADASILQVVPSYLDVLLRHLETAPRDLGRLRHVSVTGEAINKPLVARWFAQYPHISLVNAYGATEASDDTTHEVMTAVPSQELVPVGRPVNNVTVYILTRDGQLAPLGAPGEIAFSGICVGRGYINDPARTAEAFGEDPFRPGARLYRTGDFGRWLPTGTIEFLGRRDEQVKIHGIRIELGEVESRMLEHPLVQAASVVVVPLPGGNKRLSGFYTADDQLDSDELATHLRRLLPGSAVPARLHRLAALPLTANGKVDKKRLIAGEVQAATSAGAATGAAAAGAGSQTQGWTPIQQRIAHAWAQVLNRAPSELALTDNFFDLGGSSLSALRMVASLDGAIGLEDLIRDPVLGAVAQAAQRRSEAGSP